MQATLQIMDGPVKGRFIPLVDGKVTSVGSSAEANYSIIEDNELADLHFSIAFQNGGCGLRNLESTKSTSVNDEPVVGTIYLKDGDMIRAGACSFRILFMSLGDAIYSRAKEPVAAAFESLPNIQTLSSNPIDVPSDDTGSSDQIEKDALADTESSRDFGIRTDLREALDSIANVDLPYVSAFMDPNVAVSIQSLEAAVWTRQPWLLGFLRRCCQNLSAEFLHFYEMLAILGEPVDLPSILRILKAEHLGPNRLRVGGIYGHPTCLDFLLPLLSHEDLRIAVAASRAFSKISGQNFDSDLREKLPTDVGDEVLESNDEFLEEATIPDSKKATEHMKRHRTKYHAGTRWCRGIDFSKGFQSGGLKHLDQESARELSLRFHFLGQRLSHPREVIRFRPAFSTATFGNT